MYIGLHLKCSLFISGFNETWIFLMDFFEKYSNITLNENLSSGSRVVRRGQTYGRTDRQAMTNNAATTTLEAKTRGC